MDILVMHHRPVLSPSPQNSPPMMPTTSAKRKRAKSPFAHAPLGSCDDLLEKYQEELASIASRPEEITPQRNSPAPLNFVRRVTPPPTFAAHSIMSQCLAPSRRAGGAVPEGENFLRRIWSQEIIAEEEQ